MALTRPAVSFYTLGLAVVAVATGALLPAACDHGTNGAPAADGGNNGSSGAGGRSTSVSSSRGPSTGPSTTAASSGGGGSSSSGGSDGGTGTGGATNTTGVFVAVGYGGRRVRSADDGVTWVDDVSLDPDGGGTDNDLLRTVTWGPSGFVALGYRSMTSADGTSWTDHGLTNLNQWLGGAVYAKGQFVAVGGYGMRAVSADGVTWQAHSIDTIASHAGDAIVYGDVMGGRLVAANDSGQRSYSPDGVTWTYSTGATTTLTTHVAFGNGLFLGVGGTSGTDVVTSSDGGATWTVAAPLGASAVGLVFAAGQFTAVASGHVYTSTNGAAWVDHAVSGVRGGPLAYGDGTYVMVSGNAVQRSTDGLTWQAPVETGINALVWVVFGSAP